MKMEIINLECSLWKRLPVNMFSLILPVGNWISNGGPKCGFICAEEAALDLSKNHDNKR